MTGSVHNERFRPPWTLPAQQALTGLRSRELTPGGGNAPGGRSNHLVLDDTAGALQAQLRSDHQASELGLGHIHRIEDTAGRTDARGQGFELRTDGHGAVRAGKGLLVTTEARQDARAHVTDIGETVARLAEGRALHDRLATAARQARAQEAGDQDDVVASLGGQIDALGGRGGPSGRGRFPEFEAPHLALASPAGIETSTGGSTHLASGEHTAVTSGGHASVVAGKSLLVSVRDAVRLFAYNAGMRLVAAGADIDITALKQSVHILAKLSITQTAQNITITAKDEVVINGGGSYSRWNAAGITHGTTGAWTEKAASHRATGPDNRPGPALPQPIGIDELVEKRSLVFQLASHAAGGRPMAHEPYELYRSGALVEKGVTDAAGDLFIKEHQPGTTAYTVKLSNGARFDLQVRPALDPDNAGQHLSNQGYRGPKGDASRADDYGTID